MKKEINFKTEYINDEVYYFEDESSKGFLVKQGDFAQVAENTYSNFLKSDEVILDEEGNIFSKIIVKSSKAFKIMLEELEVNEEMNFWEIVIMVDDAFSKKGFDLKKFRGDLSEAIFILNNGGEKLSETETADLILDDELIEIKSFSFTSKTINISNQQIANEISTYAVGIKFDNKGKTILEIAELLTNNPEFKNYLINKYKDTAIAQRMRYSVDAVNIHEITEFIKNLKLNNFILEAKVRLII